MKKIYLFLCFIITLLSTRADAVVVDISVSNYQFSPADVNVNVGDTVRFTFVEGFHNATTNGVAGGLPAGATPVHSGDPGQATVYDYVVTVAGTYLYVCEVHGDAATYSGMKGQFIASSIVPVVLKDFIVSPVSKKPLLAWTTASEENIAYFSVRSSTDAVHFTEIGKVNAVGNSSTEQSYSFADNSVDGNANYVYYELMMVDKNGHQQLSSIQLFKNGLALPTLVKELSPNPISRPGQLMVYFNADKKDLMNVKVFDPSGKMALTVNMDAVQGLNSGHIHVCNFGAGVYTLVFSMNGLKETKRVVIN